MDNTTKACSQTQSNTLYLLIVIIFADIHAPVRPDLRDHSMVSLVKMLMSVLWILTIVLTSAQTLRVDMYAAVTLDMCSMLMVSFIVIMKQWLSGKCTRPCTKGLGFGQNFCLS